MTERDILAATYFDRADVYRQKTVRDEKTNQMRPSEELAASGLPCALSQSSSGKHVLPDGAGMTASSHVLFCGPDADIRAGELLESRTEAGQTFRLRAGRPFVYVSHAEIPLSGEERA